MALCTVGRLQLHWERATKAIHQIPRSKTPLGTHTTLPSPCLPSCSNQRQAFLVRTFQEGVKGASCLLLCWGKGGRHTVKSGIIGDENLRSILNGKSSQQQFLTMLAELHQSASDAFSLRAMGTWQWREDEAAYTTILSSKVAYTTVGRL